MVTGKSLIKLGSKIESMGFEDDIFPINDKLVTCCYEYIHRINKLETKLNNYRDLAIELVADINKLEPKQSEFSKILNEKFDSKGD